jgi:uncharacterized protein (DUF305 family)
VRRRFHEVVMMLLSSVVAVGACATSTSRPGGPEPGTAAAPTARPRAADARPAYTPADVQFMQGMIHHHAQALAMAALVPERTTRTTLRTLAARIDVSQRDEIAMMQQWLRERGQMVPDPDSMSAMHQLHAAGHDMPIASADAAPMPGMLTATQLRQLEQARGTEFDRLFLSFMIQHHEGAVEMVKRLFATPGAGQDNDVFRIASDINVDQITEIERMRSLLTQIITGGAP